MSAWSETSMAKQASAGSIGGVVADERVESEQHDVVVAQDVAQAPQIQALARRRVGDAVAAEGGGVEDHPTRPGSRTRTQVGDDGAIRSSPNRTSVRGMPRRDTNRSSGSRNASA